MTLFNRKRFTWILAISLVASAEGVITTVVGSDWVFPSRTLPSAAAPLGELKSVAVDRAGNVFGGDCGNSFIFKVTPDGAFSVVAGDGIGGSSVDGIAASARLLCPSYLAFESSGDLLFVDAGTKIRKLTTAGQLITVAGGGKERGEGVPALQASVSPSGLAVDGGEYLLFGDFK